MPLLFLIHRNFIEFLSIPVADPSLGITGSSTDTSGNKPTTTPITEASLELNAEHTLQFDIEWLAVLRKTHHLLKTDRGTVHLPTVVEPPTTEVGKIFFVTSISVRYCYFLYD